MPKSRLGFKKAKQQLALAAGRIDQALYFAEFDLRYLAGDATEQDHAFHKALLFAKVKIREAIEATS